MGRASGRGVKRSGGAIEANLNELQRYLKRLLEARFPDWDAIEDIDMDIDLVEAELYRQRVK